MSEANNHEAVALYQHGDKQQQRQQQPQTPYKNHATAAAASTRGTSGAMAGSGTPLQETAVGLICGVFFGAVSPVIGHPFDSVKTRMQADAAFRGASVMQTVSTIYRTEGIRGFYRGFLPPVVGSMFFRGVLFSAYSGTYAACEQVPLLHDPIPFTGGLRTSVLLGALAASVARAAIESPFDFIKVRYMVGQSALNDQKAVAGAAGGFAGSIKSMLTSPVQSVSILYRGFGATFFRTLGLLGSFFVMVDYSVRYIPEVINAPVYGPFFKGGICATAAWVFAFPFESAKNVIQADTTGRYKNMPGATFRVVYQLYQERGIVRGWYRGFAPGASRSFVANGASMMVYSWLQDYIRQ